MARPLVLFPRFGENRSLICHARRSQIKSPQKPKANLPGNKKNKEQNAKAKKHEQTNKKKNQRETMEYPPLANYQAQIIFDACAECDFPQSCPVELANLSYRYSTQPTNPSPPPQQSLL